MVYEMLDAIALGGIGGLAYLYMTYCIYNIFRNISGKGQETALTKLMIDEDAVYAFKILAVSTTAIAGLFTARLVVRLMDAGMRPSPFIVILPVPLMGIAYFFHQIKAVTSENSGE